MNTLLLCHRLPKVILILSLLAFIPAKADPNFFSYDFTAVEKNEALPPWLVEVSEQDGEFTDSGAWEVAAHKPFGLGQLLLVLNTDALEADLALTLGYTGDETTYFIVQLADSEGNLVCTDLYSNVAEVAEAKQTSTVIIPLGQYPEATQIAIARLEGPISIHYLSLFPVISPLDPEQANLQAFATQWNSSKTGASSENPLLESLEAKHWSDGVDWTEAQAVEPRPGRTLLELSASSDSPLTQDELLQLLKVLGLQGYGFNAVDFVEAAGQGKVEVLDLYLRAGMPIDVQGRSKYTAVAKAATAGELRAIKFLAEKGADLEKRTAGGNSALWMATYGSHPEAVRLLVRKGADIEAKGAYQRTPLYEAYLTYGYSVDISNAMMRYLLECGADPNVPDITGMSLVHKAAGNRQSKILKLLLENRGDPHAKDKYNLTPYMHARIAGRHANMRVLKEYGAEPWEPNPADANEQLILAVSDNDIKATRKALEDGADATIDDYFGNPLIFEAVDKRNIPLIKLMLDSGANIHARNFWGQAPISRLAGGYHESREKIITFLIEQGADVNYATQEDLRKKLPYWTPLMKAAAKGNRERCLYLIEMGADPTIKNLPGRTAARIAENAGFLTLAEELHEAEVKWNSSESES